jgi:hypothetical protein
MVHASDNSVRGRVEGLGQDIETLKAESAPAGVPASATHELADLAARHGELQRRLTDLEAQGETEHHIAGALTADLKGLVQSLDRWIERQDMKATIARSQCSRGSATVR